MTNGTVAARAAGVRACFSFCSGLGRSRRRQKHSESLPAPPSWRGSAVSVNYSSGGQRQPRSLYGIKELENLRASWPETGHREVRILATKHPKLRASWCTNLVSCCALQQQVFVGKDARGQLLACHRLARLNESCGQHPTQPARNQYCVSASLQRSPESARSSKFFTQKAACGT